MTTTRSLTVKLETVTPLFLGGADPRGAPELRPPAFRGALRYWLRAALGGVLGDNIEAIRQAEAAVFGSADEMTGGAAAVSVLVRHGQLAAEAYIRDRSKQPPGRDYLYWSMDTKQFIEPGSAFEIELRPRLGVRDSQSSLRQARAALWLLLHLGGIGSRSRRTGGGLSMYGSPEHEDLHYSLSGSDIPQFAQQISAGLAGVRREFAALGSGQPRVPSTFDTIHPAVCRIWVLGTWKRAGEAVDDIGAAMRGFRSYREPDHMNVARWLNGKEIDTVERAVFGLPLPFRYSAGGPSSAVQGRPGQGGIDRRASPLWLKVSRTADGVYYGVATLFKSVFLPKGERLHARGAGPPISPPQDYSLIETFIAEAFPAAQEVSYA